MQVASVSASATSQRTFVSHSGLDTNPCSVDSPCRSFAAAITQTNPSGEVVAVDSAGYGPVTISQSVTIVAPLGVHAQGIPHYHLFLQRILRLLPEG